MFIRIRIFLEFKKAQKGRNRAREPAFPVLKVPTSDLQLRVSRRMTFCVYFDNNFSSLFVIIVQLQNGRLITGSKDIRHGGVCLANHVVLVTRIIIDIDDKESEFLLRFKYKIDFEGF